MCTCSPEARFPDKSSPRACGVASVAFLGMTLYFERTLLEELIFSSHFSSGSALCYNIYVGHLPFFYQLGLVVSSQPFFLCSREMKNVNARLKAACLPKMCLFFDEMREKAHLWQVSPFLNLNAHLLSWLWGSESGSPLCGCRTSFNNTILCTYCW